MVPAHSQDAALSRFAVAGETLNVAGVTPVKTTAQARVVGSRPPLDQECLRVASFSQQKKQSRRTPLNVTTGLRLPY